MFFSQRHRASTIEDAVRVLAIIPWFHAFGFVTSMTITAFGGTMVVLPRFDNVLFLESIQNHKVGLFIHYYYYFIIIIFFTQWFLKRHRKQI